MATTAPAITADRLAAILRQHLAVDPKDHPDATTLMMVDTLKLDSLDMVELIMAVEDEFGIEIPDDAAEPFVADRGGEGGKTFADWTAWIDGMVAK